jgi:two-component system sensor histidine kinase UhpB
MKIKAWPSWGIKWRIVLISLLPALFLFFSVVFYLYQSRLIEVEQELDDRGRIVASSLATSSEYGVISGNINELERMLNGLLQVDDSIYRIQILDLNKQILVEVASTMLKDENTKAFEATISQTRINVDIFDENKVPHVDVTEKPPLAGMQNMPLGYVKVILSSSSMLTKKKEQILVGSLIATVALVLSVIFGLYLTLSLTKPLSSTISALRQIRGGNYDITLDGNVGGEIGELQSTIIEMSDNLKQFKENLENKVAARTIDLEVARNQAIKAHAENRRLIQKVHSAVEEERENISVEIHDHLNASLIVAKLSAQRIVDLIKKNPATPQSEEIRIRAQSVIDLTAELYHLARGIVKRLRPEVIDTLGLRDAIDEMVRHYDDIHPHCQFAFEAKGDFSGLPSELAISAYRLIQEALSNIVKHSDASCAWVKLDMQDHQLVIEVKDNGKGFNQASVEAGIGLIGMRERAISWDGKLEISSEAGVGTTGTTIVAKLFYSRSP